MIALCKTVGWLVLAAALLLAAAAAPALAARITVVAPLEALGIAERDATRLRHALEQELAGLPEHRLVGSARLVRLLHRRGQPECAAEPDCLAGVARQLGVERIVTGEVGSVGDGYALYLRLLNRSGRQIRAASATLELNNRQQVRELLVQLLLPRRHTGTLSVKVDVPNAWIYIDGNRVARSPAGPLPAVGVGTHALRVTHDSYRDFVRFIRVPYGRQVDVDVKLSALAVQERQMKLAGRAPRAMDDAKLPWYRRWWTLAGFGVAVAAATTVVVVLLPRSVAADRELVVSRPP